MCQAALPNLSLLVIINTSHQKLPFGSGDYPDKLLYHQTLNYVSNSSDRELPVTCFVSKPSRITLVELSIINTSYQKLPHCCKSFADPKWYHDSFQIARVYLDSVAESTPGAWVNFRL